MYSVSLLLLQFAYLLHTCTCKQPHILLIIADDYGFNDIGYHGSEIKTPILDKLANTGVKLENYYVQPVCSPTRGQLLSGKYQIHTGLQHLVIWPPQPSGLPLNSPTIADKLREAGYKTHAVGKWHIGFYKKEYVPTRRGFDSFYGLLTGAEDHYKHHRCFKDMCGYDLWNGETPVTNANGTYSTHLFTDKVIDIVNNHDSEKPLFVYLPYPAPHAPLQVPDHYRTQYKDIKDKKRQIYAGMVSAMDEAVGNITEAMKRKGLWDDTVLVFSTDNGGDPTQGGNNWPLRGTKGHLWEGGVRGVGFIHGKRLGDQAAGSVSHALMHVSDWFPTLVGLANGNLNGTLQLDGFNQWNTITAGAPSPRKELLHNIDPLFPPLGVDVGNSTFKTTTRAALRMGDWKIVTGNTGIGPWIPPPHKQPSCPITPGDSNQNVWLFNITSDPNEYYDFSAQYPEVVKQMLDRLAYYQSTAVPCHSPPDDPRADPAKLGGYWGPWLDGSSEH